jgi:diguanylate cyclase (GGDEF)-like protein
VPEHSSPPETRGPLRLAAKVAGQFLAGGLVLAAALAGLHAATGTPWHRNALPAWAQDAVFVALGAAVLFALLWRQARLDWPEHTAQARESLTGLPDREGLRASLAARLAAADGPAGWVLLLVELRGLAAVNDTRGPAVGDQVLRAVARRLADAFAHERAAGGTLARLGGDEFALLLPLPGDAAAAVGGRALAERALAAVVRPIAAKGHTLHIGARAGFAPGSAELERPGRWLQRADLALGRARAESGTLVAAFEPDLEAAARAEARVEHQLREALQTDRLALHYQPKVALADGRVVGAEALLRLPGTDGGGESDAAPAPERLIAVAERTGLIVPLGSWALRRALADAASWPGPPDGGPPAKVAVNVSPVQLSAPGFEAELDAALADSGLDPARVVLEITESALMADSDGLIDRLQQLRRRGVGLAIDDFGTGYSALAHLKRYPVSELKIDRGFVAGLGQDRYDDALVSAILQLADALDLPVVAEGVATAQQRDRLVALGCPLAQGHLFAPARAPSEFAEMLRTGTGLPARQAPGARVDNLG